MLIIQLIIKLSDFQTVVSEFRTTFCINNIFDIQNNINIFVTSKNFKA